MDESPEKLKVENPTDQVQTTVRVESSPKGFLANILEKFKRNKNSETQKTEDRLRWQLNWRISNWENRLEKDSEAARLNQKELFKSGMVGRLAAGSAGLEADTAQVLARLIGQLRMRVRPNQKSEK